MNNKFIKRVAAVVLGVAVLSTCAFAAPALSNGSCSDQLYFTLSSTADKASYIAYASADGVAKGNIIAIGQVDSSVDNQAFSIKVSESLLGSAKYVIVESGDTEGDSASINFAVSVADYIAKVNLKNDGLSEVTIGGEKFINVPQYGLNVKFNKAGSVEVTSLTAKVDGEVVNTIEAAKLNGLASTVYEADADLEVANFYLAGAPLEYIEAGIDLEAKCSFTAAE